MKVYVQCTCNNENLLTNVVYSILIGLFNSVKFILICKFTKFDTKLNVQIPVEFRSKAFTGKNAIPVPEPEFRWIYG